MADINGIVEFDDQTGLIIHNKAEILEDLKIITSSCFGGDFEIEQGSEWYSFLDTLAYNLASAAGATKSVYDSIGVINARGVTLDNAVSIAGIVREYETPAFVTIELSMSPEFNATNTKTYTINAGTILQADNGTQWQTTEDVVTTKIEVEGGDPTYEKGYVTCTAIEAPESGIPISKMLVRAYNGGTNKSWIIKSGAQTVNVPTGITLQNPLDSVDGTSEETDGQLRYRYYNSLYTQAVGTPEALRSKLTDISSINYAAIVENSNIADTASAPYNVPIHNIWVIVDGKSTWAGTNYSDDINDIAIAEAIKSYKSLGCGVFGRGEPAYNPASGTGLINVQLTDDTTGTVYEVPFTRAVDKECFANIELVYAAETSDAEKDKIIESIKNNILTYVEGLQIGEDILSQGISSAIFKTNADLGYTSYVFSVKSIGLGDTSSAADTKCAIDIYQKALMTSDNITINK